MDPARGQTLEDERIRLVSLMARHLHNRGELDVVTIDPEIIRPWATRDASTQVNPEDLDAPIGNPNLVNRSVVEATIAAVSSSRRRLSNNDLPPVNKKIKIEPGTSYQATPSEADTEVQNDDLVWSDEDDRVNSTLAKPPNGVDVGRQSTSKPTTSMTPPTTPEFSGDSSNKSIKREPSELVTNATATPRINSTHCANVGCHERSDPSSTTNLCSNCLFWLHFKCVKKSVWEEKKSPDHDSCVFCSMMKSEFGKCDLPIINESKLRGSFLKKKAKAGAPIPGTSSSDGSQQQVAVLPAEMGGQEPGIPAFPIASWEFYWNIAYTSPQNVERNFKVGDFVYVRDEDVELTVLFKIEFLIRDANKEPWARVFEYCHPENIRKDYGRKFLTNEVMEYKLTRGESVLRKPLN